MKTKNMKKVIKFDKTVEDFAPEKLIKWAAYATKKGGDWLEIASRVFDLLPNEVTSEDIHKIMTQVCIDIGGLENSRVAAVLEHAKLVKNTERYVGVSIDSTFKEALDLYQSKGIWSKDIPEYNPEWESWYEEGKKFDKEYWSLVQWSDKYSIKYDGHPIETPHVALLASSLALHGDNKDAYDCYIDQISSKLMTPTPALNGMRNGDFDTTSCSLFSAADTKESIMVSNYLTQAMTAKKAGIGNFYNTRSKGDKVRGGAIDHIGKLPIFREVEAGAKILLQLSRGGSVTTTVRALDPEIVELLYTKSQRTSIDKRIDKIDYSFAINDSFINAVKSNSDWHLFSLIDAPDVHANFHKSAEIYDREVQKALEAGVKHKVINARTLLVHFLIVRQETGRYYAINLSRVNTHTPFKDEIEMSNLCLTGDTRVVIKLDGEVHKIHLEMLVNTFKSGKYVEVLSWNEETQREEFKQVTNAALMNPNADVIEVNTNSGLDSLRGTPDHKILTKDRGYVKIKDLQQGDILVGQGDNIVVTNLVPCALKERVYDITVKDNHNFFANGIVVHNCQEIVQPTKPYIDIDDLVNGDKNGDSHGEISFCTLSGINYSKLVNASDEEIARIIKTGLKTIRRMMLKTPVLHETMSRKMLERSNAGLGISGLADWLYQQGLDFDGSKESLEAVAFLAERHAYFSYKASVELVQEGYAPAVKGIKENWLPIDDAKFLSGYELKYDWESLRGKPRAFSVHNCVQPFESSSVFFDGTNSVYPARNEVIFKTSRAGNVPQYFPHFKDKLSVWDIDTKTLCTYYSVIQDFLDLAISADTYFNPELYADGKKPLSEAIKEFVWYFGPCGGKTWYYLNTKVQQDDILFMNKENKSSLEPVQDQEFEDCEDCKM